ncbi:MAG: PEP-CTERM sorting domain-containing protein [Planctomycetota bacterium]|nr:PEP-CTERM sorting domain-containing protein [Planctomycetota bacterium]
MRWLTLLLIGGLVLAVSSQCWALSWLTPPGNEMFRLDMLDWSMAKTYLLGTPSLPTEGVAAVNGLPNTGPTPGAFAIPAARPQIGLGGIGGALAGQAEDGWGIFYINAIMADPGVTTFWSAAADPTREIVGLYYGAVDTAVAVDANGIQQVSAAGLFIDFYEQPKGTFDPTFGSAYRLAFDKYRGVGFDAAGNLIADAKLLMRLESTDNTAWAWQTAASDIDGDGDPDGDFVASFVPAAVPVGSGTGKSNMFVDLVGGDWVPFVEQAPNYFPLTDNRFGSSVDADMHAGQDFDPAALGPSDWTITSDDPTRGHFIPEPVTMVLVAFGGLGVLFGRKRK